MKQNLMRIQRFEVTVPQSEFKIEAACVECGEDLIIVIGGGSRYHLGSLGLTISMPSIKDPEKLTNSTYQVPVPGHKEEALAREASFTLSCRLKTNVLVTVGIHEDMISKDKVAVYINCFNQLIEKIQLFYQ